MTELDPLLAPRSRRKYLPVAYVLLFFLGFFGAHRLYLGLWGTALAMPALTILAVLLGMFPGLSGVAWLGVGGWVVLDAIQLPGIVRALNARPDPT